MKITFFLCLFITTFAIPAISAEQFKDVPKDHWAADSVQKLADKGIVKGYPDNTYKGDKPVTRYELAATLQRMIEYIEQSKKPIVKDEKATKSTPNWGKDAETFLKDGGYLTENSVLLQKDGSKPITADDLAQALASVAGRIIEKQVMSVNDEKPN